MVHPFSDQESEPHLPREGHLEVLSTESLVRTPGLVGTAGDLGLGIPRPPSSPYSTLPPTTTFGQGGRSDSYSVRTRSQNLTPWGRGWRWRAMFWWTGTRDSSVPPNRLHSVRRGVGIIRTP